MKNIYRRRYGGRFRVLPLCILMGFIFPAIIQAQSSSPPLATLLEKLGKQVESFRQQYPAVTCSEAVSQVKLAKGGGVVRRLESQFDYLILISPGENYLAVEESRLIKKPSAKRNDVPLLVTGGFSTMILVFHPLYQNCFEYLQLPEESIGGKRVVCIQFQHVPGTRSTACLRLNGRDVPLELKGKAWIDPETMAFIRITAELASPLTDLGLQTLTADVQYAPVRFDGAESAYWLPTSALIEVATAQQHWRNIHRFTDYRRFSVTTQSSVKR
ncbi:MAG: hypothetical protein LAP85_10080 [Acidobacteriia bacterium]|nr:hypothetical protein [Terriglobia bacterium]